MKKVLSILLSLIILCAAAIPAFAAESGTVYYVDAVEGNDANSGTAPAEAWQSLGAVSARAFCPGDKILFHCGQVFDGTLVANGSGTAENPVVISSFGEGEKPRFATESAPYLIMILGADYWTIENLDISNKNGGGLVMDAMQDDIVGITVQDCRFHDIGLHTDNVFAAAIVADNNRKDYTVQDLHINRVEISNTHWGIHINGSNVENENSQFISAEESYNNNLLLENIKIDNAACGGIVVGSAQNSVVRNCRITDCATAQGAAYAPLWIRHSNNVLIEYCEIAGATNTIDGMAVDFDGWTTNCTYDHIYSHDNTRFIKNCVFDAKTKNRGNKVTNCISVNDNGAVNMSAIMLFSTAAPSFSYMADFTFANNTIVNGTPVLWYATPLAKNQSNTFVGSFFTLLLHRICNLFALSQGNAYMSKAPADLQAQIDAILARIG